MPNRLLPPFPIIRPLSHLCYRGRMCLPLSHAGPGCEEMESHWTEEKWRFADIEGKQTHQMTVYPVPGVNFSTVAQEV